MPKSDPDEEEESSDRDEEEETPQQMLLQPKAPVLALAAAKAELPRDAEASKYSLLFYKATTSYGVRQRFDAKKQILSVCKKGTAQKTLETIAQSAIKKLNEGETESLVKAWVQEQMQKL